MLLLSSFVINHAQWKLMLKNIAAALMNDYVNKAIF